MPAQRLSIAAQAIATASGAALFQFAAPPTDLVYIGTLTLTAAPSTAAFTATVGGFPWCSWAGPSVGGPVQALPGEVVQVSATGLTAGTNYVLQWTGRSNSLHETQPQYPDTNAATTAIGQSPGSTILTTLQGGASQAIATLSGAGTTPLLVAPPTGLVYLLHNATFTLGSGATQIQIVGATTGFVYCQSFSSSEVFDPLMGQIAAEALNLVAVGGGGTCWLSYDLGAPPTGLGPGGTGFRQNGQGNFVFFSSGSAQGQWGTAPRTAGDLLLIVWAVDQLSAVGPATPAGWTVGPEGGAGSVLVGCFYKLAAGGDAAPTLTNTRNTGFQLLEFTGNGGAATVDQSGITSGAPFNPQQATSGGANAQLGELLIYATSLQTSNANDAPTTLFNNAVAHSTANALPGTGGGIVCSFGFGVGISNAAADVVTVTPQAPGAVTAMASMVVSFKHA